MKSYKQMAQEAGTTVDVVREVAKTIYEDVTGWYEAGHRGSDPWAPGYGTKTEAIIAVAKRKQAEADKRKAERDAYKADTEAAYKLMTEAGYDPHGDMDKATAIVDRLRNLADAMGVDVSDLTVDDFHEAVASREQAVATAGKAMDNHTPVRIYTANCAIYDHIAGIEGNDTIVTEHFGAVQIDDTAEVMPWDMSTTDKPMLCASGVTLKWDRGTLAHSWYESADTNGKGERLTAVEVDTIEGGTTQGWLLTTWAKRGLIPHMTAAWDTNVYVRGADGKTVQADNPQITPNGEIDFKWILERTEANRLALLLEILRRFAKAE